MSLEAQLFQNLNLAIRQCSTLLTVEYNHHHIQQMASRPGFPVPIEKRLVDQQKDNYVLITDSFADCLRHLMEARKILLMLDAQDELYPNRPTRPATSSTHDEDQDEEET